MESPVEKKLSEHCKLHGVLCFLGLSMALTTLLVVVPGFAEMFEEMGPETVHLPVSTKIVLGMGAAAEKLWFVFLPAVFAASYAASRVPRSKAWIVEIGLILVLASFTILFVVGLFAPQIHMFGPTQSGSGQ